MTRRRHARPGPFAGLAKHVGLGVAIGIALVILGPAMALTLEPILMLLAGGVVGAIIWAVTITSAPPRPDWSQPLPRTKSPLLEADQRTRRLAGAMSHARPGQGFDAGRLAVHLAAMTQRRLVQTGRIPADDGLRSADGHLSPALLTYLRSADTDHPQVLSRTALHAHLKEIDSL